MKLGVLLLYIIIAIISFSEDLFAQSTLSRQATNLIYQAMM